MTVAVPLAGVIVDQLQSWWGMKPPSNEPKSIHKKESIHSTQGLTWRGVSNLGKKNQMESQLPKRRSPGGLRQPYLTEGQGK